MLQLREGAVLTFWYCRGVACEQHWLYTSCRSLGGMLGDEMTNGLQSDTQMSVIAHNRGSIPPSVQAKSFP